ncbi:hypothetical protein WJX72_005796 [[Myrmecia] bisecta]|uniref:Mpv17-like protein 2 n=1 Tax=[Myrmecia] bisecta TaxID=41462 RepID=A0AAW1PCQ1_9CHLO
MSALRPLTRSLGKAWRAYEGVMAVAPVRTQMATSAFLWGLGDVFAQKVDGQKKLDNWHVLMSGIYGATVIGPCGHFWYQGLEKFVANRFAHGSAKFIATKVACDELIFGPLHVLSFFAFMVKAEGGSWKDVGEKIKRDFVTAYAAELVFWPTFQTINFWKVPVQHQLLAVNTACLLDSTFLCWVNKQDDWTRVLPAFMQHGAKRAATSQEELLVPSASSLKAVHKQ